MKRAMVFWFTGVFVLTISVGTDGLGKHSSGTAEEMIIVENPGSPALFSQKAESYRNSYYYSGIDFNGDGLGDQVFGSPDAEIDGQPAAGAINVIYGRSNGLRRKGNLYWHLNRSGIEGISRAGDFFGSSLAVYDLNWDGFSDLMVGASGIDDGDKFDVGALYVFWGSKSGLTLNGSIRLLGEQKGGFMGASLSAGDYNGDMIGDIGAGIPGYDIGNKTDAGAIRVYDGFRIGSQFSVGYDIGNSRLLHMNSAGVRGSAKKRDFWGLHLYSADFNNSGFDDISIGVPFGNIGGKADAGKVSILYGSGNGLTGNGSQLVRLANKTKEDHFGYSISGCYCNNDSFADVIIGVPGFDNRRGAAFLLFGNSSGVTGTGSQAILNTLGEAGDEFGFSIGSLGVRGDFALFFGAPGASIRNNNQSLPEAGAIDFARSFSGRYEVFFRFDGTELKTPRNAGDHYGFSIGVTGDRLGNNMHFLSGLPDAAVGGKFFAGASLSFKVSADYTRFTAPFTWTRSNLKGPTQSDGRFARVFPTSIYFNF